MSGTEVGETSSAGGMKGEVENEVSVHQDNAFLQLVAKPQRTDKGAALSVGAVREPPEIRALREAPLPCHMSI